MMNGKVILFGMLSIAAICQAPSENLQAQVVTKLTRLEDDLRSVRMLPVDLSTLREIEVRVQEMLRDDLSLLSGAVEHYRGYLNRVLRECADVKTECQKTLQKKTQR